MPPPGVGVEREGGGFLNVYAAPRPRAAAGGETGGGGPPARQAPRPPNAAHQWAAYIWGEGGRCKPGSTGSVDVRAGVWPARWRNGPGLVEATVKHGNFVSQSMYPIGRKQAGRRPERPTRGGAQALARKRDGDGDRALASRQGRACAGSGPAAPGSLLLLSYIRPWGRTYASLPRPGRQIPFFFASEGCGSGGWSPRVGGAAPWPARGKDCQHTQGRTTPPV